MTWVYTVDPVSVVCHIGHVIEDSQSKLKLMISIAKKMYQSIKGGYNLTVDKYVISPTFSTLEQTFGNKFEERGRNGSKPK